LANLFDGDIARVDRVDLGASVFLTSVVGIAFGVLRRRYGFRPVGVWLRHTKKEAKEITDSSPGR